MPLSQSRCTWCSFFCSFEKSLCAFFFCCCLRVRVGYSYVYEMTTTTIKDAPFAVWQRRRRRRWWQQRQRQQTACIQWNVNTFYSTMPKRPCQLYGAQVILLLHFFFQSRFRIFSAFTLKFTSYTHSHVVNLSKYALNVDVCVSVYFEYFKAMMKIMVFLRTYILQWNISKKTQKNI